MSRSRKPTTVPLEPSGPMPIEATVIAGRRRLGFKVENLSTTGARLTGGLPLQIGQRVRIVLRVDNAPSVEIVSEVDRVHSADLLADQVAVRFIDVPPSALGTIATLVDRIAAAGTAPTDDDEDRATARLPKLDAIDLDAATVRVDKKKRQP